MKKRAYSLIELIVVLAIISIILGIGLVKFNVLDKMKADIELSEMANDIDYARIKAMSTGVPYRLRIKKDSYSIEPGDFLSKDEPIEKELDYLEIGPDLAYYSEIITYNPSGSVSNPRTIVIKRKNDPKSTYKLVIIVGGGQSRIEKVK